MMDNLIELLELVEYICTHKHKDGAYIALPEAVHTYDCRYWRQGASHGPCVCGGEELQSEIDGIFGPYGQWKKKI